MYYLSNDHSFEEYKLVCIEKRNKDYFYIILLRCLLNLHALYIFKTNKNITQFLLSLALILDNFITDGTFILKYFELSSTFKKDSHFRVETARGVLKRHW